jgi:hypothetical protein
MKTNCIRTLILSAAALTMGSAAYGQATTVAQIPFSFRINGTEMPAGKYWIKRVNPTLNAVMLTDGKHQKAAMGISGGAYEPAAPKLVFSCRESSGCTLAEVWEAGGRVVAFPKPKLQRAEKERLAVVLLQRSEAE